MFIAPPLAPVVWTVILIGFPNNMPSDYFGSIFIVSLFGIPIAYAIALCIGLPLYLLFRKQRWVNFWSLSFGGAFVAALPTLLTFLFRYDSWVAGRDWKVHGLFAITGFVVGAAFWSVLRYWPHNLSFKRDCRKSAAAP
jgi:hypothetical protein